MREIKFEELSLEQKIGFVMTPLIADFNDPEKTIKNIEYVKNMVRNHSVGAIWVNFPFCKNFINIIKEIREIADYPLLIITDAENGLGEYKVGAHNAIGCTDNEELAYTFGKVTAATARQWGYNVVCDPVVDMAKGKSICGGNIRALGSDKEKVAALAKSIAKGMHDSGVLSIAKHYPGATNPPDQGEPLIDSHMAESTSKRTKEELLDYELYPYLELMKEDLLDGLMTSHCKLVNIDPDHPASLSKKVIDIIRDQGFDGIAITDGLNMMGVVAKYGVEPPYSLSIAAGNDLALPWKLRTDEVYDAMVKGFKDGLYTEDDLNRAVKRNLAAQHKVYEMESIIPEITEKDKETFKKIAKKSVYAKTDDGVHIALDKKGKYCFFILTDIATELNDDGKVDVDTFDSEWYNPYLISKRIEETYPNSKVYALTQYPLPWRISRALSDSLDYEVVFITYQKTQAYAGYECLSSRILSLMDAMQVSDRISTIVHFGNPYVLEDVPHIPRILIGGTYADSIDVAFDILEGKRPAEGKLTYDVKFK